MNPSGQIDHSETPTPPLKEESIRINYELQELDRLISLQEKKLEYLIKQREQYYIPKSIGSGETSLVAEEYFLPQFHDRMNLYGGELFTIPYTSFLGLFLVTKDLKLILKNAHNGKILYSYQLHGIKATDQLEVRTGLEHGYPFFLIYSTQQIHIYGLALWNRNREIINGNWTSLPQPNTDVWIDNEYALTLRHERTIQLPLPGYSFGIYQQRESFLMMVPLTNSSLHFYNHDGHLLNDIEVADIPTKSMVAKATGRYVGLLQSNRIVYFSLQQMLEMETPLSLSSQICHGIVDEELTDFVQDIRHINRLYVSTTANDLLTYDFRPAHGRCRLLYRSVLNNEIDTKSSRASLASINGYLLYATNEGIHVFNTTMSDRAPEYTFTYETLEEMKTSQMILSTATIQRDDSRHGNGQYVLCINLADNETVYYVYKIFMPLFIEPGYDLSWLRIPIIIIVSLMVFLWKYFSTKKPDPNNPFLEERLHGYGDAAIHDAMQRRREFPRGSYAQERDQYEKCMEPPTRHPYGYHTDHL